LAGILSALRRNVSVALPSCSLSGVIIVTPSLTAPLCSTLLSAPHRHRHEQHHEHDRARDRDYDHTGANREHDKDGAHHVSPSAGPFLQHTRHDRQAGAVHKVQSLLLQDRHPEELASLSSRSRAPSGPPDLAAGTEARHEHLAGETRASRELDVPNAKTDRYLREARESHAMMPAA
jgi:hypothetical protein